MDYATSIAKQNLRDEIALELMFRFASNPSYAYQDERMVHAAFRLADDAINRIQSDVKVMEAQHRMKQEKEAKAKAINECAKTKTLDELAKTKEELSKHCANQEAANDFADALAFLFNLNTTPKKG